MDGVLCDFSAAYQHALIQNPGIKFPQSQFDFFRKLKPIKDAITAVNAIRASSLFDPYILTAPSTRNPLSYLEKRVWIEDHFDYPFVDKLILCRHKQLLKGDYLIDDNLSGNGQEAFEGQLLHFGSEQYPDWQSVLEFLRLTL